MKNQELWNKLQDLNLDDPNAAFSLSQRLARENGWSIDYSKRVIDEYKKFLYLSVVEDFSLTPSDEVDQAWHLHMIYTNSYWNDLCKNTLSVNIHHGPTKGGESEKNKYNDQYAKTLELYKETFGHDAPGDIWPDIKKRFSNIVYRRVNMHENFVLNKSKAERYMLLFVIAPILFLLSFIFMSARGVNWGKAFLVMFFILIFIFIIRGVWRYINRNNRNIGGSSGGVSGDSGCTVFSSFLGCGTDSGCSSSGCGSSGCGGCGGCGD